MNVQAKVFYGLVSNPTEGFWLTLPMDSEDLDKKIAQRAIPTMEYGIMELKTELPLEVRTYFHPEDLNQDLKIFAAYEERGQLPLLLSAYLFKSNDLEGAIDVVEGGHYEFYEDVTDEESLGQAVLDSGGLGLVLMNVEAFEHLPEMKRLKKRNLLHLDLIKMYLDVGAIGRDRVANRCVIYPILKTAFMETSR